MARINFSRKQNKKSTTKKSGKKHTKQNKKQGGRKTYKKRGGNDNNGHQNEPKKKSFFSKLFKKSEKIEIKQIKAPLMNSSKSRPEATLLFWKKYFCLKLEQYQDRWLSYDTEEPFDDIQRYYNYIYNVTETMVGNIRDKLIDNNPTNYTFNYIMGEGKNIKHKFDEKTIEKAFENINKVGGISESKDGIKKFLDSRTDYDEGYSILTSKEILGNFRNGILPREDNGRVKHNFLSRHNVNGLDLPPDLPDANWCTITIEKMNNLTPSYNDGKQAIENYLKWIPDEDARKRNKACNEYNRIMANEEYPSQKTLNLEQKCGADLFMPRY
tara:strand:+ start:535 stop:1515 length:981 start_codon:yes stop_codon:yes gene_type:complete